MSGTGGADTLPARVVDAQDQGWHATRATDHGQTVYRADYGYHRDGLDDYLPYTELQRDHGPLRPVLPITAEDRRLLQQALEIAGRKAVTTIAAAVHGPALLSVSLTANWDDLQTGKRPMASL